MTKRASSKNTLVMLTDLVAVLFTVTVGIMAFVSAIDLSAGDHPPSLLTAQALVIMSAVLALYQLVILRSVWKHCNDTQARSTTLIITFLHTVSLLYLVGDWSDYWNNYQENHKPSYGTGRVVVVWFATIGVWLPILNYFVPHKKVDTYKIR